MHYLHKLTQIEFIWQILFTHTSLHTSLMYVIIVCSIDFILISVSLSIFATDPKNLLHALLKNISFIPSKIGDIKWQHISSKKYSNRKKYPNNFYSNSLNSHWIVLVLVKRKIMKLFRYQRIKKFFKLSIKLTNSLRMEDLFSWGLVVWSHFLWGQFLLFW